MSGHNTGGADPHAASALRYHGKPLREASRALIMIHGRGATAESILSLADELPAADMVYVAPQAAGHTWYPLSFMAPMERNEPWLSSALATVGRTLSDVERAGIPAERTYILGFSQGACLASEFVARHARRYGGLFALSGGLIGPEGTPRDYAGSLDGTPVFFGCSDIDAHIPATRVEESARILEALGGAVDLRLYRGMGHTVNRDELDAVASILAGG